MCPYCTTNICFFLKFAAKQPWVYLNLEFFDKYIDVIFSNWVQLSFLILFQMKFLFVIRIPLEANHDCWDCLLRLCVASCIVMEHSIVEENSICTALTPAWQQPKDKPPPYPGRKYERSRPACLGCIHEGAQTVLISCHTWWVVVIKISWFRHRITKQE